jgi:hypothetical protein
MRAIARTLLLLTATLASAQVNLPANGRLDSAKIQTSGERAIFAIFHASWCSWCKRLDAFLGSPEIQPVIDKYFVQVYFTVQEHGDKKDLNTPGADEFLNQWGGNDSGLPFFAFLDSKGVMVVNSIEPPRDGRKAANIGFPDADHEVDWFLTMLSKAAPAMTAGERATLEKSLRPPKK